MKQARFLAEGKTRALRQGINGPYTQECIPDYLRQFRELYPEAAISLREGGRKEMLEALEEEALDVIVIPDYGLALDERFDLIELSSERTKYDLRSVMLQTAIHSASCLSKLVPYIHSKFPPQCKSLCTAQITKRRAKSLPSDNPCKCPFNHLVTALSQAI